MCLCLFKVDMEVQMMCVLIDSRLKTNQRKEDRKTNGEA